jgi:hypothetical protein
VVQTAVPGLEAFKDDFFWISDFPIWEPEELKMQKEASEEVSEA